MNKTAPIVWLLFLVFSGVSTQSDKLQKLSFLKGTWQIEGKQTYESWQIDGNRMVGESYTMKDDKKYVMEALEIKAQDKDIIYTATVKDQNNGKGIPFVLHIIDDTTYSFENETHDFPKKIQYTILSNKELLVKVLGANDQGFSFKMLRKN
jgi:hypothetical protein